MYQVLYIFHLNCTISLKSGYYHLPYEHDESEALGDGFAQNNILISELAFYPGHVQLWILSTYVMWLES